MLMYVGKSRRLAEEGRRFIPIFRRLTFLVVFGVVLVTQLCQSV